MPSWITMKALGYLSGGLGLALVAASIFGWVQTSRLDAAQATIAAKEEVIAAYELRVELDQAKIAERDALIAEQNAAVQALAEASKANRQAYELRIAQAQLVGWLEGLFHGIQAAIFAQQVAAKAQLDQMRGAPQLPSMPMTPGQAPQGDQSDSQSGVGHYL